MNGMPSENGSFVNGSWLTEGQPFQTINPSTGQPIAEVVAADDKTVELAIEAAENGFKKWSKLSVEDRVEYLKRLKSVILSEITEIARVVATEQGKPYTEALLVEVLPAIDSLDFYISKASRYLRPLKVRHWQALFKNKKAYYRFDPLGVVAIISPWNYPFVIPFLDAVAALVSGNTVVLKPSSVTPLTGIMIAKLFERAGFPEGTFNLLIGKSDVGQKLITSGSVRVVMFTGSVETGKYIYEKSASSLKKLVLELGGKDAAVVMPDANMDRAVNGILWGAFMNSGQTCASIERIYVHESVYDEFVERLTERASSLKVGDPMAHDTEIGPMTTPMQLNKVLMQVRDAISAGATVTTGGRTSENGFFLTPIVMVGVNHSMSIMQDETFGPVAPIMKFKTIDEAISLANDTKYGLTASVWTRDRKVARKFIEAAEAGNITVNDHVFSFGEPEGAWGGVRFSGVGRTHGRFGLHELVNIKFVSEDFGSITSQLWWYPYDVGLRDIAELAGISMFHTNHIVKISATLRLLRHYRRLIKSLGFKSLLMNLGKFL